MTPRGSTQKLAAHSVGKHLVLRHYLDAWLPILTMTHPVVAIVDGFAGRGTYAGGEPGSPLIALNALMEHRDREKFKSKILFFFVEKNKTSAEHLKRLVQSIPLEGPPEIEIQVIGAPFEKAIVSILDGLQAGGREVPPSFVMIDPYGVSQTPLQVIRRILRNDSSEVYITFMYNFISRFRSEAGFEDALNSLFGSNDWEPGREITDTNQKKQFFYDLYKRKLKSAGAEFVVNFELYSGNRLYYPIFFGTKRIEGADKMKQAIWRMDPTGGYRFRGTLRRQSVLDGGMVDAHQLQDELRQTFRGRGDVQIEAVKDFMMSDQTSFHSGHLLEHALIPMAESGELQATRSDGRRAMRQFPKGTVLRFGEPQGSQATMNI